jgi:hypothetical protein
VLATEEQNSGRSSFKNEARDHEALENTHL